MVSASPLRSVRGLASKTMTVECRLADGNGGERTLRMNYKGNTVPRFLEIIIKDGAEISCCYANDDRGDPQSSTMITVTN